MPWVKQDKCIGCGACVKVCPVGAISIKNGKAVVDQNKCIKCGRCAGVCPQGAIRPNSENPSLRGHQFGGPGFGRGRGRGRGFGFGGRNY